MRFISGAIIILYIILLPINSLFAQDRINIFDNDVRIIESDQSGITFTYMAPTASLVTPEGYSEQYKAPMMARTARITEEGAPLLPVKLVPLGVPFNSNPQIKVISSSYEPMARVEVPNFVSAKSEQQFLAKAQNQQIKSNWPLQTVYIESESILRGLKVIKLALAATKLEGGMLYQAKSITVRVDYNGEDIDRRYMPRPNGRVFDRLMSDVIANFEVSSNFRIDWPPIPMRTSTAVSAFDSSQVWIRMEIIASAVYRLSRFELNNLGLDLSGVDPRTIRMFYGGGEELPVDNDVARPEFREIPIFIEGEEDGVFDGNDVVLFYGESIDRLKYDEELERLTFLKNHYTSRNVYWLTYDGSFSSVPKRWESIDGTPDSPAIDVTSFTDLVHEEHDLTFNLESISGDAVDNFNWYAGNQQSFNYNSQLFDVVSGSEAYIVIKTKRYFDTLKVNNSVVQRDHASNDYSEYYTTALRNGTGFNSISLSNDDGFSLDFIDIHYQRMLNVIDNKLHFFGPEQIGTIEYSLAEVPSDYLLLNVSSVFDAGRIVNGNLSGSTLRFQHHNNARRQYYLTSPSEYRGVNNIEVYEGDDLRLASNGADYIIVTHEDYYDQALELKAHRESMMEGFRVKVVKIDDIYNQFSWGIFDPTAIRDFLKYAYENWAGSPPSYAVLIGDGHYDYRNNWNNNIVNYIPPFHSTNSSSGGKPYGSDESYIHFGEYGYVDGDQSGSPDMIIGRIPVNNTDQMEVVLDKIVNYEANPEMGKWRNTVIIVADDNLTEGHRSNEYYHTTQAESLASNCVPDEMEVKKIYMVDYPLRSGNTKPDAREALISAFNDGGLIVDWIGHGNKGLWAHESLFRRIEDMPRLTNGYKLPLVFAASCSISYFDHPTEQGMAEDFVRHPGGGGIACIGATRKVSSSGNSLLNKDMYNSLLFADSVSFGAAMFEAKYLREIPPHRPSVNSRKFLLFGDPALIAAKPTLTTEFTYEPDSLKGLNVDSISGYVTNDSGLIQTGYNGTIWVLVKDAAINYRNFLTDYSGNPTGSFIDYVVPGPTIFYGPAEVVNGAFSSKFFIPKDITYGGSGAKIFVYFEDGSIDGHGVIDSLPMSGSIVAVDDSVGPTIEVSFNGSNLNEDRGALPDQAILEVRLHDEHGINITGTMGHGLEIEIDDGDTYSEDITDNFIFDMGEWQLGGATFRIPELDEGDHLLTIKAWDNYNNSSTFSTYITVFADDKFSISEVMNYPNPVVETNSTVFQYMLTNDAEKVSLKIFTLAGRKIRTFDLSAPEFITSGYHFIPYDLRDTDGDDLASGVYIYKVEATGVGFDSERRNTNFISKLAILR